MEDAHPTGPVGRRDAIGVDQGLAVDGVRKVLYAVLANALGELEGPRLLRGAPLPAGEPRRFQGLARAEGPGERWSARVHRRAVRHGIDGEPAGGARVREL